MSIPLEHDYIGLAETSSMERSSEKISPSSSSSSPHATEGNNSSGSGNKTALNLKETELRLGLPGFQSPERKPGPVGVSLFGKDLENKSNGSSPAPLKNFVFGAKRGFADVIDGSPGNWVFSANVKSDVDLGKGAVLFSTGGEKNNTRQTCLSIPAKTKIGGVPPSPKPVQEKKDKVSTANEHGSPPAAKAQVVGWPPIRSYRKNTIVSNLVKNGEDGEGKPGAGCLYVKVSMEGAPYLRKVDLKNYHNYMELSSALEKMFSCFIIGHCSSNGLPGGDGLSKRCLKDLLHSSEYVLTYEDKDGDWMLVGDVPWEMFADTCRRLRIMKGSEAIGLAPRAMEKSKTQS